MAGVAPVVVVLVRDGSVVVAVAVLSLQLQRLLSLLLSSLLLPISTTQQEATGSRTTQQGTTQQ